VSYRYYHTVDGWQFQWYTTPDTRCPYADGPPPTILIAADSVGANAAAFWPKARLHAEGYERDSRGHRVRTGTCTACGTKVEVLGWRAKVTRPMDDQGLFREVVREEVFGLRKEAKAWAHDEWNRHVDVMNEVEA
jgi:hypothetical protein